MVTETIIGTATAFYVLLGIVLAAYCLAKVQIASVLRKKLGGLGHLPTTTKIEEGIWAIFAKENVQPVDGDAAKEAALRQIAAISSLYLSYVRNDVVFAECLQIVAWRTVKLRHEVRAAVRLWQNRDVEGDRARPDDLPLGLPSRWLAGPIRRGIIGRSNRTHERGFADLVGRCYDHADLRSGLQQRLNMVGSHSGP